MKTTNGRGGGVLDRAGRRRGPGRIDRDGLPDDGRPE